MAGVFEVEVDGVEHDHGLERHDGPNQVNKSSDDEVLCRAKEIMLKFHSGDGCHLGTTTSRSHEVAQGFSPPV